MKTSIMKFNLHMICTVQKVKKYTFHFQLYNLRRLPHENTLLETEKNKIWIPSVTFANTANQVYIKKMKLK